MTLTPRKSLKPMKSPYDYSTDEDELGAVFIDVPQYSVDEEEEATVVDKAPEKALPSDDSDLGAVFISTPDAEEEVVEEGPKGLTGEEFRSLGSFGRGAVAGFLGLPGNIGKLFELGADTLHDLIIGMAPEEEREKLQEEATRMRALRGATQPSLPATVDIEEVIDKLTGGSLAPQTGAQRTAGTAGEFLGGAAFPLGGPLTVRGAAGALGGGVATQLAEEKEAGTAVKLGAGLAGTLLGGKVQGLIKSPMEELAATRAIIPKSTPAIKSAIKAAEAENITLPYSAMTESSMQRWAEKQLQTNPFSKSDYKSLFNRANQEYINSYEKALEKISASQFANKLEAGMAAREGLKSAVKKDKTYVDSAYDAMNDVVKKVGDPRIKKTGLVKLGEEMVEDLNKSLIPSTEELGTKASFETLRDSIKELSKGKGKEQGIELSRLLATERSLNDIINWETQGGSKALLKAYKGKVEEAITSYGKKDRIFNDAWQRAKGRFGEHANKYRNDLINSMLFGENPELILHKMGSLDGIKKVKSALTSVDDKQGQQLFKSLKRFKLEDMIGRNVINPGTGEVRYQNVARILNDPRQKPILQELMGPKSYKNFENLQKVAEGISKGFNEFANPSRSADTALAGGMVSATVGAGLVGLATGDLRYLASSASSIAVPKLTARMLTNEKFLQEATKLAKAGNAGNRKAWDQALKGVLTQMQDMTSDFDEIYESEFAED